jgi:hypothetical protein
MKTVVIKKQSDLDALPDSFEEFTTIEIRSENSDWLYVKKDWDNSSVEAKGSSKVVALGNSRVEARDNSSVEARGSSKVVTWSNSSVEARGNSSVEARDNSSVEARDSSKVVAWDNSRVEAWDNSSVVAWDNSRVKARGSSKVVALGNSSVESRGNSSVEARGNSSVEAWHSSSVEAWDNSSVESRGNSSVEARGNSSVEAWHSSSVEAWDNSSVVAWHNSSVEAWHNSSVEAWDNSRVEARGSSNVQLFISAYAMVLSSKVLIKKLMDYSTAVFKGCPVNVEEKSNTSHAREIPKEIEPSFEEWLRRGYVYADGICKKLKSQKKIGEIEVFECEDFLQKNISYVVKRNNTFSHGETIKKAIEDMRYKVSGRDVSEFESWKDNPDQEVTIDDAIAAYRTITGACEFGVKEFVKSIEVPKKLTPRLILKITKGHFGNDDFGKFLADG